jgi:hypothetical protein
VVNEATTKVYVAQSNGLVLVFSTATGKTAAISTYDLTSLSTVLTSITYDTVSTNLFVGTNGKGIIRLNTTESFPRKKFLEFSRR